MMTRTGLKPILATALILAMSGSGLAQTGADDNAAHHPEAATPENGAPHAGDPPMQGMDMVTPEMMQMMMRMMREGGMSGMMGEGGMPGRMGSMSRGPMGESMTGPGMSGMIGGGAMPMGSMMRGHHGAMGGHGIGPDALYGMPQGSVSEMTPARVEAFLSHLLERHSNPRLELGDIEEAEDGSIIAEIVTTDGSLVQRLSFNRYPGLFRQID